MLHLPTPRTNNHASFNQPSNLYSYTRNSFNRSVAMNTSRISKHRTHTSKGDVTLYGLKKGYIQVSTSYPINSISMEWSTTKSCIVVRGTLNSTSFDNLARTNKTNRVFKSFDKITYARAYLKSFT